MGDEEGGTASHNTTSVEHNQTISISAHAEESKYKSLYDHRTLMVLSKCGVFSRL